MSTLGKVPGWGDTHYLLFYFCWLGGLDVDATSRVTAQLADPTYATIVERTDNRKLSNETRWPYYRMFTEIVLTKLAVTRPRSRQAAGLMLLLVDVEKSLGCRAERLFADARGLDVISPSFADDIGGPLGDDIAHLKTFDAAVGVGRRPAELVPIALRGSG